MPVIDRMNRFRGKSVFVTGGARGQGRSHAVAMAQEGASIVTIDICEPIPGAEPYESATEADLKETARLVEAAGQRCIAVKADARDEAAVEAVTGRAIEEFGRLDVLIVNHGIVMNRTWEQMTNDMWDTIIGINLTAPWRVAKAVIPHMVRQQGGSIIFTSSVAALTPYAALAGYSASKAGLLGLTRSLAAELAPHLIRVNAVLPGNVGTPMLLNPGVAAMFAGRDGATIEDMKFPAQSTMLLPIPWMEAEDISNGVLFLASEEGAVHHRCRSTNRRRNPLPTSRSPADCSRENRKARSTSRRVESH